MAVRYAVIEHGDVHTECVSGPAMVLVRDKKGHLFGGYAAEGWSKHGQFYGSALSFIFSVSPAVARFRASGANDNMLWCGQGFSQLPNGIGWGGKVSI